MLHLSKRKRTRKALWILLVAVAVLLVMVAFLWPSNEAPKYVPGSQVMGINSKLERILPDDVPPVRFESVAVQAGVLFKHFYGRRGSRIVEDMGSGLAWIDYNNDGYDDLFAINYAGPTDMTASELQQSPAHNKLFRNNGDGTFSDVSEAAGLMDRMRGMGVACADYNNDDFIDCLVTGYHENRLYKNNGNGSFTDVTKLAGLDQMFGLRAGAAWGDADLDGKLDLYVTGYVDFFELPESQAMENLQEPPSINPSVFDPLTNYLFRNNGDGTFTDISMPSAVENNRGKSLGATWANLDNVGSFELYVTNDVSDNVLYQNKGDLLFQNISYQAKVADYRGSMGLAVGDWNNDLALDLFISHWIAEENGLYTNYLYRKEASGTLVFRDEADLYGLGQSSLDYVGWGTFFFDMDNDGRLDLFVANGHTSQQRNNLERLTPMRDQLFWNRNDSEGFYEISDRAGDYFKQEFVGRGSASADFNNDGLQDIAIINHSDKLILLKNSSPVNNNWLQIKLKGTQSNRSALGTRIILSIGQSNQIREVGAQAPYLSQNSLIQHFGLQQEDEIELLQIIWPTGNKQIFKNIKVNQRIIITEDDDTYATF